MYFRFQYIYVLSPRFFSWVFITRLFWLSCNFCPRQLQLCHCLNHFSSLSEFWARQNEHKHLSQSFSQLSDKLEQTTHFLLVRLVLLPLELGIGAALGHRMLSLRLPLNWEKAGKRTDKDVTSFSTLSNFFHNLSSTFGYFPKFWQNWFWCVCCCCCFYFCLCSCGGMSPWCCLLCHFQWHHLYLALFLTYRKYLTLVIIMYYYIRALKVIFFSAND